MNDATITPLRLTLLRHADAEWPLPGQRDFDRRLSHYGTNEAKYSGEFLRNIGFTPERIVTSPARRCLETLQVILDTIGTPIPTDEAISLYNSSTDEYLSTIAQYIDHTSLLLAGHNPILEELVARLVGNQIANEAMPDGFQTGAIAVIDIDRRSPNFSKSGTLISFFNSSHMT